MRTPGSKALLVAVGLATTAALTASCSIGPDDLPSPRGGATDGYDIELNFTSALNLPTGASVMLDGLRIGEVDDVRTGDQSVVVSAIIATGAQVPGASTAAIRQDTVLGDTYVAIERPEPDDADSSVLTAGESIPIERTSSAPTLEDTLAVLATFVNGGTIQRVESSIAQINDVMPDAVDLQKLASTVSTDLGDLSTGTGEIDRLLRGLDDTAISVNQREARIDAMLAPEGVLFWDKLSRQIIMHIGTLLPSIGSIFAGGTWLVPMLEAADRALSSVVRSGIDPVSDSELVSDFLEKTVVPFAREPSFEVESVETSDGRPLADVENVLRMLGATR